MLSEETIDRLNERLILRINETNEYIIKEIAKKIKQIGSLTPTEAQKVAQILKYGGDYNKIIKKIQQMTKLNMKEIRQIFQEVAKLNYNSVEALYKARGLAYIPYEENKALQKQVNAIAQITLEKYANLSNTRGLGYIVRDAEKGLVFRDLGYIYKDVIDKAVLSVGQGKETFDKQMYDIIKDIGTSGLRSIEFENSNYTRRVDSQVRMNMLGGLRDLTNGVQLEVGKQFHSDGVEISVHEYPAPDHANVQGKQFSNEEFEKFQNDKDATSYDGEKFPHISLETKQDRRSIGQYNCYHYIFSIVLGVSKPRYSKKELKAIQERNAKGFELDGKHYTMYQGTQMQRQLETRIREQKDFQIMGKEADNKEAVSKAQENITKLTKKYKEFSELAGLKPKMDRLRTPGYKRIAKSKLK